MGEPGSSSRFAGNKNESAEDGLQFSSLCVDGWRVETPIRNSGSGRPDIIKRKKFHLNLRNTATELERFFSCGFTNENIRKLNLTAAAAKRYRFQLFLRADINIISGRIKSRFM